MTNNQRKARKELSRANKALLAAKILLERRLYEDSVSRAYYAVLHAAKAALVMIGLEPESHHAVRRLFGLHLVKSGEIEKDFARILAAEQEDREIGDYDIDVEIEHDRALKRVAEAEEFVERIVEYLPESADERKEN
ncbi:MAG: HEPN domain-containing protein [Phycisphaerales bacterium]|nr:MAG: HEPN domain-containing protein [Phycisphaerales bacterium]